jgi:P pilus assembly chaperone PapD
MLRRILYQIDMKLTLTIAIIALFLCPVLSKAQGNLLITPRRIVFEGGKRTQEVNLANTGTDTARYAVSMIQYRMEKDGSFKELTAPDSGQNFSDKFVRFFPRNVTLAPNETQVIRLQIINPQQLKTGEYRSAHVF